jgi:sugar lactone lactonase YvrE
MTSLKQYCRPMCFHIVSVLTTFLLVISLASQSVAQVWLPSITLGSDKTSQSSLGLPWDVDVTESGDIYVADHVQLKIKVFSYSGTLLRTFGGAGVADGQLAAINGISVSHDNYVYVTDRDSNRVVVYTSSGEFVKFLGATILFSPRGLAVDGDTIVVTDAWNSRIVRLSRNDGSLLNSFGSFGSAAGQFNDPQSLDVAPNGDIIVVDTYNNRVQVFTSSGLFKYMFGVYGTGDAQFNYPHGIAVDDGGYIYVSDTRNSRYQRFSSKGVWTTTVNLSNGKDYFGIDIDKDGRSYMCNIVSGLVEIFDKVNPTYKLKGQLLSRDTAGTQFMYTTGVAEDNLGNVYVTEYFDGSVFKFGQNLEPLGIINQNYPLVYPYGLAVDSHNRIFVANAVAYGNSIGNVVKVDTSTLVSTPFGSLNLPTAVAVGESGHLFVVETYGHRISEFDESGNYLKSIGGYGSGPLQFDNPQGIVVGHNGLIYVADTGNNRVQVLNEAGILLRQWTVPDVPHGISMDVAGNIVVTQRVGRRYSMYTPSGTLLYSFGHNSFNDSYQSFVRKNGDILATNIGSNCIDIWTPYIPDDIAPSSTIKFFPTITAGIWQTSDVRADVISTDNHPTASKVKAIHYAINQGTETVVTGSSASFTLTENGTHSIAYWAVDNSGNVETTKYATVRIDKVAPVTTLTRSGGQITLSAADAHSGVSKTKVQVNGGAVADYTGAFADTVHTVTYWSEDVAGNVESAKTEIINPGVQSISASQVRLPGGFGVIGIVTLDKTAPFGGTVVNLASSNMGVVTVDATVTVPEGATTATFDIDANPVANDTVVSVSASKYETSQSLLLTIQAPTPSSLSYQSTTLSGGTSTTATISISGPAPVGGTVVSLASSSLSALVPTSVTIPSGQMTATFTVSTNLVANDTSAVISAIVYGVKVKSTLSILGPKVTSVTLASASIASGATTTGTVTLSTNAPVGGKVVTLSSSNTGVATVPVSVTVPVGTRTATFTITAGTVAANTAVTITAATNGSTGTASVTVTPPAAALSTLTTNVTAATGGVNVTGTVTLTRAAPTGGAVVTLASSSTTVGTVPVRVTVAAGATTATFTITTRTVTSASTLTVTGTYLGIAKSVSITVNPVRLVSSLTLNPTSVRGGVNSTGTVTLTGPATEAVVVTLTSGTTTVARVPATVTVPAGATTATFAITTLTQTATRTSVITARTGTTSRTATLSVTR